MHRIRVLFPDPDSPQSTTTDPFSTVAEHSLSTRKPPYHLVTLRISIIALADSRRSREPAPNVPTKTYITSAIPDVRVKTGHSAPRVPVISFAEQTCP